MTITEPRACVIGHPIAHSRSPMIHGYWLKELGLSGQYGREDVAPVDFSAFIGSLREKGYVGCNVTLPHKEAAFRLVERATERAKQLQVVNTLWFEGDTLCGDNTDIEGFLSNLDDQAPQWSHSLDKAVVLGAGGAAASIIAGLKERGAREIVLINRTLERAEIMAKRFGSTIRPMDWSGASDALDRCSIVVNTTSLGMKGQPALDIDLEKLPPTALVTDIVYVPLETGLLRQARERGNPVADGLGMLLHQAVPGFEHWFGQRPTVTAALRALIEADLTGVRS